MFSSDPHDTFLGTLLYYIDNCKHDWVNITVKLDFMLGKILPLKDIIKIESILWLKIKTFGCEPLMFDPYDCIHAYTK